MIICESERVGAPGADAYLSDATPADATPGSPTVVAEGGG
jgi:hypothetical protein